jgi:hypothetical protein
MATYERPQYLAQITHAAFNTWYSPGQVPPFSGIYRCLGCGREVVAEQSRQLPPQNHHQHSVQQGTIRWLLIVYADHNPKQ